MKVNGVQKCFKNINRCNLHPQCDPVKGSGDDKTSEDELDCDEEYQRKKLISRQATFRCQSPHHNEDSVKANLSRGVVWIKSVPQDGIPECWKDQDEDPTPSYLAYGLPGCIQWSKTITFFRNFMYIPFSFLPCRPCTGLDPCRSNTEALLRNG